MFSFFFICILQQNHYLPVTERKAVGIYPHSDTSFTEGIPGMDGFFMYFAFLSLPAGYA